MIEDSIFVSYCYEHMPSEKPNAFVEELSNFLPQYIDIVFDKKYLRTGKDIQEFTNYLNRVPIVILLLTPKFKERTDNGIGIVSKEFEIIKERFLDEKDNIKILPIIFSGDESSSKPSILKNIVHDEFQNFHRISKKVERTGVTHTYLPETVKDVFLPKLKSLAESIEKKIQANLYNRNIDIDKYYNSLFVTTKIDREFIEKHRDAFNRIFIETRAYSNVKNQYSYFIIGRKGTGKSTIANSLPIICSDTYKTSISISADHFNLQGTYQLTSNLDIKLASEIDGYHQEDILFKYAWYGLLYVSTAKELKKLSLNKKLNDKQIQYQNILIESYDKFILEPQNDIDIELIYNSAHRAVLEYWQSLIETAPTNKNENDFYKFLDINMNVEKYLEFYLGVNLLTAIRDIIRNCDKKTIITLDDFDTVFDRFRGDEDTSDENIIDRCKYERRWLDSLMILIHESKGKKPGEKDEVFDKLDFCIALPLDRFFEIVERDRDGYLSMETTCMLEWSGIDLADLLIRRLAFIYKHQLETNLSKEEQLNKILAKHLPNIPRYLSFNNNNSTTNIHIFSYILKYTFWRPRDVLKYFASIMGAAIEAKKMGHNETLGMQLIENLMTGWKDNILKTEFISEYNSQFGNISEIVNLFIGQNQVIDYNNLVDILQNENFYIPQRYGETLKTIEKIRYLFEIGFLGIKVNEKTMHNEKIPFRDCFCFNEGYSVFEIMSKINFLDCSFIIHPIFSEFLHLKNDDLDFISDYSWDYLVNNHIIKRSGIKL